MKISEIEDENGPIPEFKNNFWKVTGKLLSDQKIASTHKIRKQFNLENEKNLTNVYCKKIQTH